MEQRIENSIRSEDEARPLKGSGGRIGRFLWFGLLLGLVAAVVAPLNYGVLRVFIVVTVVGLWAGAVVSCREKKRLALIVILFGLVPMLLLCLPGREVEVTALQREYVQRLRAYGGTRYLWGGENRFGIDCSAEFLRQGTLEHPGRDCPA